MKTKITRRLFLKKGSLLGATLIVDAWTIPEFLHGMIPLDYYRKSGAIAWICQVKKEVYVPSPEPRVGTSVSMTYIGRKLRCEEVRSLIRSSDWADTVRRLTSEDTGKNWSDWKLECKQSPTKGEFTQSGGESQRGTGPYDKGAFLPYYTYNFCNLYYLLRIICPKDSFKVFCIFLQIRYIMT